LLLFGERYVMGSSSTNTLSSRILPDRAIMLR